MEWLYLHNSCIKSSHYNMIHLLWSIRIDPKYGVKSDSIVHVYSMHQQYILIL